jgi:lysozyme
MLANARSPQRLLQSFTSRFHQLGEASRTVVATLALSAAGLVGIAGYESYRGDAYLDSVAVPTVGYGTTAGVKLGDKTTPERALVRLLTDATGAGEAVRGCITAPLFQNEFDAYVSLAYNIGAKAFCGSTLVQLLNQGQYKAACDQLLRWDRAGGKQLRGLTVRRQAEWRTCTGKPS